MTEKIGEAHELISQDAVGGAMTKICGAGFIPQQVFRDTLRLASRLDDEDWAFVYAWLEQQD